MSADPKIKKRRRRIYVVTVIILWLIVFFPFTIINYNDGTKTRPMLAFIVERNPGSRGILAAIRGYFTSGLTLGRYRIETEYGQIIIRSFSRIQSGRDRQLVHISSHGFMARRITHNLVVDRIPLSGIILIVFNNGRTGVTWSDHEAVVSGITLPVRVGSWAFGSPVSPWDRPLSFAGDIPPGDITLADSTRISFPTSLRVWQLVFQEDDTWFLWDFGGTQRHTCYFLVKYPGEEEYASRL